MSCTSSMIMSWNPWAFLPWTRSTMNVCKKFLCSSHVSPSVVLMPKNLKCVVVVFIWTKISFLIQCWNYQFFLFDRRFRRTCLDGHWILFVQRLLLSLARNSRQQQASSLGKYWKCRHTSCLIFYNFCRHSWRLWMEYGRAMVLQLDLKKYLVVTKSKTTIKSIVKITWWKLSWPYWRSQNWNYQNCNDGRCDHVQRRHLGLCVFLLSFGYKLRKCCLSVQVQPHQPSTPHALICYQIVDETARYLKNKVQLDYWKFF